MTHNEERAHWIKEGAIGLGGKFIQYLSVELEVKYSCQSRLDKECYCYPNLVEIRIPKKLDEEPTEKFLRNPNLNEIIVTPSPHYKATVCAKNVS
jgi:hypothetical protein